MDSLGARNYDVFLFTQAGFVRVFFATCTAAHALMRSCGAQLGCMLAALADATVLGLVLGLIL